MRTTKKSETPIRMCVDTGELQALLGCGRKSALEIGCAAQAKVTIGRRILWNTEKVRDYLNSISTD